MRPLRPALDIIHDTTLNTKVQVFFSTKVAGDDYDPYENNFTLTNLSPITIKAYFRELTAENVFYKQYGQHQDGVGEIITEDKYRPYFELANKIVIHGIEYQNFKDGQGNRTLITARPFRMLRVVVSRNG